LLEAKKKEKKKKKKKKEKIFHWSSQKLIQTTVINENWTLK